MSNNKVATERIGDNRDVVKISIEGEFDHTSDVKELQATIDSCFQKGNYKIILDMEKVDFPPNSFIALLIEATSRARRAGGDLRLINLSTSARNNFITFSPLSYLAVRQSEEIALQDLQKVHILKPSEPLPTEMVGERQLRVESRIDYLYKICDFVTDLARQAGMEKIEISRVKIAVYEASINVVEHAYHSEPHHFIDVAVNYDAKRFVITIMDRGDSFDFNVVKPYDVEEAMNKRKMGGFGLYIIQRSMDEVRYESDPEEGNKLTMVKYL